MKKINLFLLAMVVLLAFSCKSDKKKATKTDVAKTTETKQNTELLDKAKTLFKVLPKNAATETHKITANKVALGKKLYYETMLSNKKTQSCNTCHNLKTYGVDNQPTSKGDKGGLGGRNSPTVDAPPDPQKCLGVPGPPALPPATKPGAPPPLSRPW